MKKERGERDRREDGIYNEREEKEGREEIQRVVTGERREVY